MTPSITPEKLDAATIETIKNDLLERQRQIMAEMNQLAGEKNGNNKVKFPDYGTKSDENAQEIDEYTTNLATEKVLESSLRDINSALDRIEKGNYGTCKYCQQPIGKKRMLARPVASTCVSCKTKLQSAN